MENVSKPRVAFFDVFKALLIFCVVAGHGIETGIAGPSLAASATYMFFYLFHMPAFLFLLGWFSKSTARSGRKLLSRLCFFLALYALCKLVYYGGYKLITGELPWWKADSFWAEDSPPWYMLTAALYMAVLWLARKTPGWLAVPLALALGLFSGAIPGIGAMLTLSRALVYLPVFLLGFYWPVGSFERFLAKKRAWYWLGALALAAVWMACRGWLGADPGRYARVMPILYANNSFAALGFGLAEGLAVRAAVYAVNLVVAAFAAMTAAAVAQAEPGRLVLQMGRNTLVPYIVHYPVFLYCRLALAPELTGASFLLLVVVLLAFCSLDVWENALRLLQKGFYALFGLVFREKDGAEG